MSEPDEIRFACPGCGAWEPSELEACSRCGHRFGGSDLTRVKYVLAPRGSRKFARRPVATASSPTFRIGSTLVLIAMIAVCLAAIRESLGLGIFLTISIVPPTFWTLRVARRRRLEGLPMEVIEKAGTFFLSIVAVWFIVISSLFVGLAFAFVAGAVVRDEGAAAMVGGITWIATAAFLTFVFFRLDAIRATWPRDWDER